MATKIKAIYWNAPVPQRDFAGDEICEIFIDGKTRLGPWGLMTPKTFTRYGLGFGVGRGQMYIKQSDGRWMQDDGSKSS